MNTYRLVQRPKKSAVWRTMAEHTIATTSSGIHNLIITLAVLTMFTILLLTGKVSVDSPLILIGFILTVTLSFCSAAYRAGQESRAKIKQPSLTSEQFHKLVREEMTRRTNQEITEPMPVASNGHKS